MKKTILLFITFFVAVFLNSSLFSYAQSENIELIKSTENLNETAYESGVQKLLDYGLTQEMINMFSVDLVERINNIIDIEVSESYLIEKDNNLVECTKDEALRRVELINNQQIETQEISLPKKNTDSISTSGDTGIDEVNRSLDQGTLRIITIVEKRNNSASGRFTLLSCFEWLTMPSYRGIDFFSVCHSSLVATEEEGFEAKVSYTSILSIYQATQTQILLLSQETQYSDTPFSIDDVTTDNGYSLEFNLPNDIGLPSMLPGTMAASREYVYCMGYITYEGSVYLYDSLPQSYNHFIAYAHQKGYKFNIQPALTISLVNGIDFTATITPEAYYILITDIILSVADLPAINQGYSISADNTSYYSAERIDVSVTGINNLNAWVGLYPADTRDYALSPTGMWCYVANGTQQQPESLKSSATVNLWACTRDVNKSLTYALPIGYYKIVLFADNGYTPVATWQIYIQNSIIESASYDKTTDKITFTLTGVMRNDAWIGIYPTDQNEYNAQKPSLCWGYVSNGGQQAIVSCPNLATGIYKVVLFADGGYTPIATVDRMLFTRPIV